MTGTVEPHSGVHKSLLGKHEERPRRQEDATCSNAMPLRAKFLLISSPCNIAKLETYALNILSCRTVSTGLEGMVQSPH